MNRIWRDIGIVLLILLVLAAAYIGIGYVRGTVHFGDGGTASKKLVEGSFTPGNPASLVIDADVANINVTAGATWSVEYALYFEPKITEANGVLTIQDTPKKDKSLWFSFGKSISASPYINVTVPAEIALDLDTDVGDVRIEGLTLGGAELSADVGNVTLQDVQAASLKAEVDTGDVFMNQVTASDSLDVECDVGNVTLSEVNARSVTATSDVGDLNVNLTGPLTDYALMVDADVGDIVVDGLKQGKFYNTEGGIPVFLKTDTGDINVSFGS